MKESPANYVAGVFLQASCRLPLDGLPELRMQLVAYRLLVLSR
jgi:hypothetical protein